MPFMITLTAVAAVGVFALAAHHWITEPVRNKPTEMVNKEQKDTGGMEEPQLPQDSSETVESEDAPAQGETPSKYQGELDDPTYLAENNIYVREPAVSGQDRKSVV